MSPEILIVAIGCYLFCGIEEKIYRIKTGDWRTGSIHDDFNDKLSNFSFVPMETTYEQVIEAFGNTYARQRTHRVIRTQIYDDKKYYFNKEVRFVYRKGYKLSTHAFDMYYSSDLEVYLFFKDNILQFYDINDERVDEKTGRRYFGRYHNSLFKEASKVEGCNKLFYDIFTLYKLSSWYYASHCDFHKDTTYWDDPVYNWRKYFNAKGESPCGGRFYNSCEYVE